VDQGNSIYLDLAVAVRSVVESGRGNHAAAEVVVDHMCIEMAEVAPLMILGDFRSLGEP
jgi:hypothetical protein